MNLPTVKPKGLRIWPSVLFLIATLLVVFVSSWYSHRALAEISASSERRAQARVGRLLLEQTQSLLKDLETGVRGFELTGKDIYLDPYRQALAAFPTVYANTKEALGEQLPDGITWTEIDHLLLQRLDLLKQGIAARQTQGENVLQAIDLLNSGKDSMDRIRERFQRIDQFQDQRIAQFIEDGKQARQLAGQRAWIADALAFTFIVLAISLLVRERYFRMQLERQLWLVNSDLEAKVDQRTHALAEAHDRIAAFATEQDRAIETERRRIARDVHDQIGQVFTAIKLIIQSMPETAYPNGQREALDQALEMGISCTRRIAAELRPPLLDDLGLAAALDHFAGHIARTGKVTCEVQVRDIERLTDNQSLGLFRIIQEAVTNVLRHAEAQCIVISGQCELAHYRMQIADNGHGFDPATVRPDAMGLANIRERALLLNGWSTIASQPGTGTRVDIFLPVLATANNEP